MNIFDEVKQIFSMILEHHEDLEKLAFSARMKNGALITYNFDRKKIERELEKKNQPRGRREIFNAVLDIFGVAVSISFLVILILFAIDRGTYIHVATYAIYGTIIVLYFLVSTLYHFLTDIMKLKNVFQRLVELFSYFLMAGTYIPLFLTTLDRGETGWALFITVWALCVLGIFFKYSNTKLSNNIAEVIFILMIWVFLPRVVTIFEVLGGTRATWLMAGAIFYTLWRAGKIIRKIQKYDQDSDTVHFDISNLFVLFANFFFFLILLNEVV